MSKILTTILVFCLSFSAISQEKPYKLNIKGSQSNINSDWRISASAGIAIPIGSFANSDPESNNSGFANSGFMFNLSGQRLINSRVSLIGSYIYSTNSLDNSSFKQMLSNRLPEGIEDLAIDFDNSTANVTHNNWTTNSFMVGAGYKVLRRENDLTLFGKVGAAYIYPPSHTFTIDDVDGLYQYRDMGTDHGFFTYAAEAEGMYEFKIKNINMIARLSYYFNKFDYDYTQDVSRTLANEEGTSNLVEASDSITTQLIKIGIGITF